MSRLSILLFFISFCCAAGAQDNNKTPIEQSTVSNIFRPRRVDATPDRVKLLKVPQGFRVEVFAEGTGHPRMMKVMPDGRVYVTDRNNGRLLLIKDTDNDGKADLKEVLFETEHLHGIDFFNNKLYLVTVKDVYTAEIKSNGTLGKIKTIIADLPDAGQHHNRTLKFGPDTLLYISIGSTCNSCVETNREAAAMIRVQSDGTHRMTFCKGLRNTIGFDWHPVTKALWGWDNGIDHLGDTIGKEELNRLQENGDYGWPYVFEKGKFDRHHDHPKMSHEEYAAKTIYPDLLYDAHGASMEFMFYRGKQFPKEYMNDGFVAMRGSWNRQQPAGYCVLRVRFSKAGEPVALEPFLEGFLTDNNTSEFGRPVGIAQYIDGSLLVTDDVNGNIYRIIYSKE